MALALLTGPAAAAHAGWSPPIKISPGNELVSSVEAAAGARGDQAVVWSRTIDSYNSTVGMALHRPGAHGFASATISDPEPPPQDRREEITTGQNYDPTVAVSPAGEVTALWVWDDMRAMVVPPGATVGTRVSLGPSNTSTSNPGLGYDAAGNLTAFWVAPGGDNLMTAYKPAGGQFGPAQPIPNPDGNGPRWPHYAVAANGDALVTWTNGLQVFMAVRKAGESSFGEAQAFSAEESPVAHIATDPKGNALVTWVDRSDPAGNGTVEAAFRPAGGKFGPPTQLGQVFSHSFQAFAAMSKDGEGTVSWAGNVLEPSFDAQGTAVTRSPSGKWGEYEAIATDHGGDDHASGYDGDGNLYAAWTSNATYAAVRGRGQKFSGTTTQLSDPGEATEYTRLAASPSGTGAIAAWAPSSYPDASPIPVQASVFSGEPATAGSGTDEPPANGGPDSTGQPVTGSHRAPRSRRCVRARRTVRHAVSVRNRRLARYRRRHTPLNRASLNAARRRLRHALAARHAAC